MTARASAILAIAAAAVCLCGFRPGAHPGARTRRDPATSYWTTFTASSDTRTIYVSSSGGNDNNNGLSSGAPKATISAGLALLRDGYPDWLLFKAGDSWNTGIGQFDHKGRSSSEPMLVGSYGSGARPLFKTGNQGALTFTGGSGSTNTDRDYLAFVSLDFYADSRDPDSPSYNAGTIGSPEGFTWRQGAHWVLFEDVRFRFFGNGGSIHMSSSPQYDIGGFRFRRCQFTDNYTDDGSHAQGIYVDEISADGLVMDQCLYDYNGYRDGIYSKDIFSHDMYIDGDPGLHDGPSYTFTDNIILRGASHGMQLRAGGAQTGNYVEDCAIGLLFGASGYAAVVGGLTSRNTILHGHYSENPSLPKQYGLWCENITTATASYNLIANAFDDQAGSAIVHGTGCDPNMTFTGNVVYNWPVGSNLSGSYTDTTRDLAHYDAHLGGPGTFAHAVTQLRAQSKASWDDNWSTTSIQTWIRAGWNLTP